MPVPNLPDTSITVKVNATTGEVVDVTGLPDLNGQSGINADQLKDALKQSFAQLPKTGKAKLGDSWDVESPVPSTVPNVTVDSKLKSHIKYEAKEKRDGFELAKLSSTMEGPLDMSMSQQGMKITMKGSITGDGVSYVDLKNGLANSGSANMTMKLTQTMEGGNLPSAVSLDLEMKLKMNLTHK